MAQLTRGRLRKCISGISCNLSSEEIEELYNQHSNVVDNLPDDLLLELLENMDYTSAGRFCSSSPRIEAVCRDYNVQSWFRVEEDDKTYLITGAVNDSNRKKVLHSWNDKPAVTEYGTKYWYKEGKIHRDDDKPALIFHNGDQYWYKEGKIHRDNDKPAVIRSNGIQHWFKEGKQYFPG